MFDLDRARAAVRDHGLDGWLLYDFRGSNPLAANVAGTAGRHTTRRWFYYVPAAGEPNKLVHAIEPAALDHLPGAKAVYLRWQELEAGVGRLVAGAKAVAMEYSPRNANPYVSRVDAGTVELVRSFGPEVVSSGDLIQQFDAVWDDDQVRTHLGASALTDAAFGKAWAFIADQLRRHGHTSELAVQAHILEHFRANGLVTDSPPIVAVWAHSGDPHFEPHPSTDAAIEAGSYVLVDLWAKLDRPRAVYSDLTRVAFVGDDVPAEVDAVFRAVRAARDAAVDRVRRAFQRDEPLAGWEVDAAAREVIDAAGYGEYFIHRTGHNIGTHTHGTGAHMDSLETRDTRRVLRRTCFSVEPGVYLPKFGVRSEVNVYVDAAGGVHVTGGDPQTEVRRILPSDEAPAAAPS